MSDSGKVTDAQRPYLDILAAACKPFGCDCLAEDCPMCGSVDMALLNALPQVAALIRDERPGDGAQAEAWWDVAEFIDSLTCEKGSEA